MVGKSSDWFGIRSLQRLNAPVAESQPASLNSLTRGLIQRALLAVIWDRFSMKAALLRKSNVSSRNHVRSRSHLVDGRLANSLESRLTIRVERIRLHD